MKKVYNPYDKNSIANQWIDYIDKINKETNPTLEFLSIMSNWNGDFSDCSVLDI